MGYCAKKENNEANGGASKTTHRAHPLGCSQPQLVFFLRGIIHSVHVQHLSQDRQGETGLKARAGYYWMVSRPHGPQPCKLRRLSALPRSMTIMVSNRRGAAFFEKKKTLDSRLPPVFYSAAINSKLKYYFKY
jgi:hypothetical protein